jgi:hypothetical protein
MTRTDMIEMLKAIQRQSRDNTLAYPDGSLGSESWQHIIDDIANTIVDLYNCLDPREGVLE